MPLQSETSLKCYLHCLGPHAAIVGYPCEWVATARFVLGAAEGFLWGWSRDYEKIECLRNQTDHYSREFGVRELIHIPWTGLGGRARWDRGTQQG